MPVAAQPFITLTAFEFKDLDLGRALVGNDLRGNAGVIDEGSTHRNSRFVADQEDFVELEPRAYVRVYLVEGDNVSLADAVLAVLRADDGKHNYRLFYLIF